MSNLVMPQNTHLTVWAYLKDLQEQIVGRKHKPIYKTGVYPGEGEWEGSYYLNHHQHIIIVAWEDGTVRLDNGGHMSTSTKLRLNRCLPVGYSVFQKDFNWFVQTPNGDEPWDRGMELNVQPYKSVGVQEVLDTWRIRVVGPL